MAARRELHTLIDEAMHDSPRRALAAYRQLVDTELPWIERRAVHRARAAGMTWADIGRLLKRSRQAVQERFGTWPGLGEILPPAAASPGEADDRYYAELIADARRRVRFDEDEDGSVVPW